ncbi:MAG: quinone-dependent dihydroorotate dehydrogenase [Gemmataceae bacterium]
MFYKTLIRPILFRFDAERAHHFALHAATILARRRWLADRIHSFVAPSCEPTTVAGISFPNRIGLAGGMDKNAVAPRAWWAFGFGFIELGTITPKPQAGNDKPRMFRIPKDRAVRNRMGFNNDGAEVVAARLAELTTSGLRPPFPIGISVGKNKDTPAESAADDYALAASRLAPHADFITINVSSPNTPGLRAFQDVDSLKPLIRATKAVIAGKPLFVKFAPELTGDPLAAVVDGCLEEGCQGIIATNTMAQFDAAGKPIGGLSGKPLKEISPLRVAEIRKRMGDGPALIGCGGIDDVASARRMIDSGANLIQLYTALVYEGPFLAARLARGLSRSS